MKILIVGGGGREHALGWRLSQDPSAPVLLAAPGNPGLAELGRCFDVPVTDATALAALAARERVDLVVVGPESALAVGLADRLATLGIACFGPTAAAAQLEASKAFTKAFCDRHAIPTASYAVFTDALSAKANLAGREAPFVIKADGLAAGKGVVIATSRAEADAAIDEALFHKKFGSAGETIIIEDFLPGEEVSFFALCDGATAVPFGAAQDHKRAYDGDKGPNTGGMGAYSPVAVMTEALTQEIMATIILPTVRGMAAEGAPFVGVLFAGLMISQGRPKLIEFNTRFGDPECQTLLPLLEGDLSATLKAAADGRLDAAAPLSQRPGASVTVVLAAQGYPDLPLTGSVIRGAAAAQDISGVQVFHAGTRRDEEGLLRASGGRVLNITATAPRLTEAVALAYAGVDAIDWPGGFCRRDIASRAPTG
jgi:phosphoribosylamine--glycine ligase